VSPVSLLDCGDSDTHCLACELEATKFLARLLWTAVWKPQYWSPGSLVNCEGPGLTPGHREVRVPLPLEPTIGGGSPWVEPCPAVWLLQGAQCRGDQATAHWL
jgi:hypothetical protein